jgi:NADH:ubiquinone oxidoreductase subunit C
MFMVQLMTAVVPSMVVAQQAVEFEMQTASGQLLKLLDVLKSHSLMQMKNLVEVTIIDVPINALRFYVTYFLLSTHFNVRVSVSVQTNEMLPVISVTSLFNSIN